MSLLTHNNTLGIALMATSMAFFGAADTIAKFFTETYHPIQVVGIRQTGLLAGVILYAIFVKAPSFRGSRMGLQIFRGFCATFSAVLFVVGLKFIPLNEATSIAFVAPFFVTLLGMFLLKEPVGPRRVTAIALGFCGTLVIVRPGFDSFHPAHLAILAAAFLFAARQIISRFLTRTDDTLTTVAFTAGTSVFLLALAQPFVWTPIQSGAHLGLFILYAALAGMGEFLVIRALEVAFAVIVAPLQYTILIWTSLYGFVFFGVLPDRYILIGAAIIILSGSYSFYREYRVKYAASKVT